MGIRYYVNDEVGIHCMLYAEEENKDELLTGAYIHDCMHIQLGRYITTSAI